MELIESLYNKAIAILRRRLLSGKFVSLLINLEVAETEDLTTETEVQPSIAVEVQLLTEVETVPLSI